MCESSSVSPSSSFDSSVRRIELYRDVVCVSRLLRYEDMLFGRNLFRGIKEGQISQAWGRFWMWLVAQRTPGPSFVAVTAMMQVRINLRPGLSSSSCLLWLCNAVSDLLSNKRRRRVRHEFQNYAEHMDNKRIDVEQSQQVHSNHHTPNQLHLRPTVSGPVVASCCCRVGADEPAVKYHS